MIITCPRCQMEYRLDPRRLGVSGHKVHCTSCDFMWFQAHVKEKRIEEVLSEAGMVVAEESLPPEEMPDLVPAERPEELPDDLPEGVRPGQGNESQGIVYRSMSMAPVPFGICVFLFCVFVSSSALLLARGLVVQAWPGAAVLYQLAGLEMPAPGEGLRFQAFVAENRVDDGKRTLFLRAQIMNMTDGEMPYPALGVSLKSAYGAVLREWTVEGAEMKPIAPGQAVPVELTFDDPPEGGTDAEIKVIVP